MKSLRCEQDDWTVEINVKCKIESKLIMLSKVLILTFVTFVLSADERDKETIVATKDLDYSGLAGEAEMNKHDILSFLNQSHVREQYKNLYNCLLSKLMGKTNYILLYI